MNGYIEAGYIVCLGSLTLYGISLVARERVARRRATRAALVVRETEQLAPSESPPAS